MLEYFCENTLFITIIFALWAQPVMLRNYYWLCTQKLILVFLGYSYGVPRIKPSHHMKVSALPALLDIWP